MHLHQFVKGSKLTISGEKKINAQYYQSKSAATEGWHQKSNGAQGLDDDVT